MTKNGLHHKHFPMSRFSAKGLAWFKFACSCFLPCLHVSDVTWERAKLVYAIMTRVPIDMILFINTVMLRTTSHESSGLWLPSLITIVCRKAYMIMENDMEILPGGRYIVHIHHQQRPPFVGPSGQAFPRLSISRHLTSLRFTQVPWISYEHEVHTQISINLRRNTNDRGLQFLPFPGFPEDAFHIPGEVGESASEARMMTIVEMIMLIWMSDWFPGFLFTSS